MSKIGVLTTGVGVVSTFNLSWVPQFILVTNVVTANILSAISIVIGGQTTQNVIGQALVGAVMKYLMEASNGAIGLLWKVTSGFIGDQTCQINLTNTGANVNEIRAFSGRKKGVPYLAGTQPVLANTSVVFRNFTALFFEAANFDAAQIQFADGHNERLNAAECAALFTVENQADANGLLNAVTVIDNKLGNIEYIEVYANATGTLSVVQLTAFGL
jgi:hypothetical protein